LVTKILIIRFSSIGDIILTTPIIRCIKQQMPNTEIHFVCKERFKEVIENNPNIDKLHLFKEGINELLPTLQKEKFTHVIDLHNNLRSLRLKKVLNVKSYSFKKLNFQKIITVWFKKTSVLPPIHIVHRYLDTVRDLGVKDDGLGLDYYLPAIDKLQVFGKLNTEVFPNYIALVAGGSYYTKRIPLEKLIEICRNTQKQIIVLGDVNDNKTAQQLAAQCPNVINACGKLNLHESAYIIKESELVISSDTGLMHIAAAFGKKIYSFWGNTIPEFGMYPYKPGEGSKILEVKNLKCRPCSKLGYNKCPKGNFNCMMNQDISELNL